METTSHNPNNEHGSLDLGTHYHNPSNVSPLEQEVLDEYARLARNMERLSTTLTNLTNPPPPPPPMKTTTTPTTTTTSSPPPHSPPATTPPAPALTLEIAESLRLLERKVASVYTLLKASVYSIVLQQGEAEAEMEGDTSQGSAREGVEW